MKRIYPKPTPLQRGKHLVYWLFVGLTIVPFCVFVVAGKIAEFMDAFLGAVRRWCFTERYVPRENLPPRRDKR